MQNCKIFLNSRFPLRDNKVLCVWGNLAAERNDLIIITLSYTLSYTSLPPSQSTLRPSPRFYYPATLTKYTSTQIISAWLERKNLACNKSQLPSSHSLHDYFVHAYITQHLYGLVCAYLSTLCQFIHLNFPFIVFLHYSNDSEYEGCVFKD